MKDKILKDLFAARSVRDFGMKLEAVEFSNGIFDRGERRIFCVRRRAKSCGHGRDLVAVAVPDVDLFADAVEELRTIRDVEHAGAVFASGTEFHLAAEMVRHQLHSVANSQHRNAERKNLRIGVRCAFVVNAGRTAGKNDALSVSARRFRPPACRIERSRNRPGIHEFGAR